jgi:hypothetical protein
MNFSTVILFEELTDKSAEADPFYSKKKLTIT